MVIITKISLLLSEYCGACQLGRIYTAFQQNHKQMEKTCKCLFSPFSEQLCCIERHICLFERKLAVRFESALYFSIEIVDHA